MRIFRAVAAYLILVVLAAVADEPADPPADAAPADDGGEGGGGGEGEGGGDEGSGDEGGGDKGGGGEGDGGGAAPAGDGNSVIVGDYRVQALSPYLLRVEPKGPNGFEDRTTFTVVNRDFEGLTLQKDEKDGQLKTDHYTVQVGDGSIQVWDGDGNDVYNSGAAPAGNKLHWPAPYSSAGYAILDYPRFFMPEWKVAPVSPEDGGANNGYDFGNDVEGDTYIFLMGKGIEGWNAARKDFLKLTGFVPLIPDWAFGTWFTWWHFYTEDVAKSEVQRWIDDKVPLDVWGLDMNWRMTEDGADLQYDQPNGSAFSDYEGWFGWLSERGIHTYFNDHPGQQAPQTTPDEVNFRWNGLTSWMDKGLSFWWFDHNWKFSIPPPNAEPPAVTSGTAVSEWEGLTTSCWGSHVYYSVVEQYNLKNRPDDKFHGGRPIILSMQAPHNEISGYNVDENPLVEGAIAAPLDPMLMAEHPAHHRYPVWWNGDFATMNNNLEAMVDGGVHDLKPYVHPDCGGDGWFKTVTELLRQTQMCAFGTILRFHGGPHQPWIYGDWWEDNIRKYINFRYKFMPMIIAGGQRAKTGFPFVARCDLYWPEEGGSTSNLQYMFLDDILVAPIFDSSDNYTERDVWIPPGAWQDAWSGEVAYGPGAQHIGQPQDRMPMWIRMDGGMLIMTDKPGLTVEGGDWSTLVVEIWPCPKAMTTKRTIYERSTQEYPPSQDVTLSTDGSGTATVEMTSSDDQRAWVVRVNLLVGQTVVSASVDGKSVDTKEYGPAENDDGTLWQGYWPFGGEGSNPAAKAGTVVELKMPASTSARKVEVVIGDGNGGGKKPETKPAVPETKPAAETTAKPETLPATEAKPETQPATEAPSTSSSPQYDCDAGFDNWKAGWSDGKKAWCCEKESKGCVADEQPAAAAEQPAAATPAAAEAAAPAAAGLAAGWETKVDPSTGKTYYWNAATGTSQWTPPTLRLSENTAHRLVAKVVPVASCAGVAGLVAAAALTAAAARAARQRTSYQLMEGPPQSPEASTPLVDQSITEEEA
ncbi:unnamed protein product [Prorocentrum cordatum]|uniref:WW domain-containing protein n=1 Tax=Prorocentrum cordatum TaxID=2364126 RepID=A0ABN9Y0Z6_9DINO|nr:unnamed protein product [Polarella glacialis]